MKFSIFQKKIGRLVFLETGLKPDFE